ncbi:hypothetical protein Tco_1536794, partial [Tanacetum coccineum]
DSDSDVEEDQRTNNEFMADLNAEYHERALLANKKRFYKRSGRVGSARKPIDKSKETCFTCGKPKDERTTKIRAFMAIAKDEPSVGKVDVISGQWVNITMKKVNRLLSMTDGDERKHVLDFSHVDLHYVEDQRKNLDEISDLKKVIEKWTCNKVTFDQLLSEQIPSNIVKALGGRGKRKERISSKEVIFTKADESLSMSILEITYDSESKCETHKPLPPLPKLIGVAPAGTSDSLISLADLTLIMSDLTLNTYVPKKTKPTSVKVSPAYVIKKKTKNKSPAIPKYCFDKKADSSTEQLLLTLMEE